MPTVTMNISTWGQAAFPTSERLLVRFVPRGAAVGGSIFPAREERVEPDSNGDVTVELAQTTELTPPGWFSIIVEWFDRHPIEGWTLSGWSEIPGRLHVPAAGGDVSDLLGDYSATELPVFQGYGPPPPWLPGGGIYFDIDSQEGVDIYTDGSGVIV